MDRVQYEAIVIQDLLNLEKDGQLNLTPWYQRRSVWNESQKSYLINTLHEKKPIPALYIRHSLDLEKAKSIKEVVDGQQRTRSIIEYYENRYKAKHPSYDQKVFFSDLKKSEKESFLLTSIPVGYLLGATDGDVIDIFARINSISKSLNTQEKLNAAHSGDFKQFCVKHATKWLGFWREYKVFSATKISRMEEVAFISDLCINLLEGIGDASARKTEKYYQDFDESFKDEKILAKRLDKIFETLLSLDPSSIKETIFCRSPLVFSLALIIDQMGVKGVKLEKAMFRIDEIYNSDDGDKNKRDRDFAAAIGASTHRRTQRLTRDKYIKNFLK